MEIKLASKYGFCFGVKRAIEISEEHKGSVTYGPLIHNPDEIERLKKNFNIEVANNLKDINSEDVVIIRTHGIPKNELEFLKKQNNKIIDATCPYVTNLNKLYRRCQMMDIVLLSLEIKSIQR